MKPDSTYRQRCTFGCDLRKFAIEGSSADSVDYHFALK
jgi:hypothetical protein